MNRGDFHMAITTADLRPQLTHMAIFVWDMPKMRQFYTDVFGLTVTDEGRHTAAPVDMVFMSADPGEHHQFVLVSGRPEDAKFNVTQQMSFLVDSLDQLREMRDRMVTAGLDISRSVTHGNAWSIYFNDPEGNQIEVYVHTPWYIPQPHGYPMDLDQSNDEIMAMTEAHCRETAGFMSQGQREVNMRRMIGVND
jgi:catechol 2,3-dioxygenase